MGALISAVVLLLMPWTPACDALDALDVVRAEAWRRGDPDLLATVYAAGAGTADVARLAAWADRGLRVEGARTLRARCREHGQVVRVVERLGPATAVGPHGARRPLPQDGWDRRRISLDFDGGRWRIVTVS